MLSSREPGAPGHWGDLIFSRGNGCSVTRAGRPLRSRVLHGALRRSAAPQRVAEIKIDCFGLRAAPHPPVGAAGHRHVYVMTRGWVLLHPPFGAGLGALPARRMSPVGLPPLRAAGVESAPSPSILNLRRQVSSEVSAHLPWCAQVAKFLRGGISWSRCDPGRSLHDFAAQSVRDQR